jgi:hypothetical protein
LSRGISFLGLVVFFAISSLSAAPQSPVVYSYGRTAAPRGTRISAELKDAIQMNRLRLGDHVKLRLGEDITDPATKAVIVPQNATLSATVRHVARSEGADPFKVCIVLEDAEWETGSKILTAVVSSLDAANHLAKAAAGDAPVQPAAITSSAAPISLQYDQQWGNLIVAARIPKGTRLYFEVPRPTLPGRYSNENNREEYMDVQRDGTVFLHQKQDSSGRYQLADNVLSLNFGSWGMKIAVDGDRLIDKSWGQKTVWVKQCLAVPGC